MRLLAVAKPSVARQRRRRAARGSARLRRASGARAPARASHAASSPSTRARLGHRDVAAACASDSRAGRVPARRRLAGSAGGSGDFGHARGARVRAQRDSPSAASGTANTSIPSSTAPTHSNSHPWDRPEAILCRPRGRRNRSVRPGAGPGGRGARARRSAARVPRSATNGRGAADDALERGDDGLVVGVRTPPRAARRRAPGSRRRGRRGRRRARRRRRQTARMRVSMHSSSAVRPRG